jgi:hypothetical protein
MPFSRVRQGQTQRHGKGTVGTVVEIPFVSFLGPSLEKDLEIINLSENPIYIAHQPDDASLGQPHAIPGAVRALSEHIAGAVMACYIGIIAQKRAARVAW